MLLSRYVPHCRNEGSGDVLVRGISLKVTTFDAAPNVLELLGVVQRCPSLIRELASVEVIVCDIHTDDVLGRPPVQTELLRSEVLLPGLRL